MKTLFFPSLLIVRIAFFTMALSMGSACKKSNTVPNPTTTNPPANEVWMQNSAFNPNSITVAVNTTVKWTNKDGTTHNVTGAGGSFNSGSINTGGTYSHQFTATGTYPYTCTIHSGMSGTVIVQ